MLNHNVSFSIYMAHGGTSFGFDAGANYFPPFTPQITSYDYDAPISEAGWATPKFYALRELFSKHLNPGETLPEVPPQNQIIKIAPIELSECAPLFDNLPKPKKVEHPKPMESFDQGHGAILYRTKLPAGDAAQLRITELHDYGLIFLDGKQISTLDRHLNQNSARLPARRSPATLDLLVDTFGHINYGKKMGERKGITDKVELETAEATNILSSWEVFNLPFDNREIGHLMFKAGAAASPAFYRGSFSLAQTGDTFLDLSSWNKGMVWVNGHNLGRFWNIGPQQTLYCPSPWLKMGRNEIVVLEFNAPRHAPIAGLSEPILSRNK
jgi:beta-galactosidase